MKKILNFILISIFAFILMLLAVFCFWELYAKDYVEKYLDENYGHAIIETNNNVNLIKNFKPFKNDKNGS